mgnify:CR=1 FL=1
MSTRKNKASQSGDTTTHYRDGKKTLVFTPKKGEVMDTCATIHDEYICCNVKVLKSVSNCPFDCSYCFLQNYLTNPTLQSVSDIQGMMTEVNEKRMAQPWRFFRIGTWELGDSLALEYETGQAKALVKAFSELQNVVLELKTKSDCVDTLLDLDHQGRTVVSWSMNSNYIIDTVEHKTAKLNQRLDAIKKVVNSGYLVGIHFDPMIRHENWEEGYSEVVMKLIDIIPAKQMAWISFGSLRFNPEQEKLMENNFPGNHLTKVETVLGSDNKVRYVKPHRIEMYRHMRSMLEPYIKNDVLVYLCMERWDMWEKIMGFNPGSIGDLDYLFADSFHRRFPGIVPEKPNRELYIEFQDT